MATIKHLVACSALSLLACSVQAGGFVDVLNTGERTPGSVNNIETDPFYISGIPANWSLLDTRTTAVSFDVYNAGRTALLGNFTVGTFIDSVWSDASTNSLVFGSYFKLDDASHGITEINSLVRSGFGDFDTVSAAWTRAAGIYAGAANGYRLRDPARSDYVAIYDAANAAAGGYRDLDKIAIRTDVSLAETNPNSGIYFLSVDATGYTYEWSDDVIRIVQGASSSEGGRIFQDTHLAGFRAVAAVPEPSEYAMFLAGLGMVGFVARRRMNRI